MLRDTLGLLLAMLRFGATAAITQLVVRVEWRLASCRARYAMRRPQGPITRGAAKLCGLAQSLWWLAFGHWLDEVLVTDTGSAVRPCEECD